MAQVNYLLGHAEKLVRKIDPPRIKPTKAHPYTFDQAQARVVRCMATTAEELATIPQAACPQGEAVAMVTLHPAYLAKTQFPIALWQETNLTPIGSRPRTISPKRWAIRNPPKEAITTEVFVAGKRQDFAALSRIIASWSEESRAAVDLRKVEDIRVFPVKERLGPSPRASGEFFWEIVLHANQLPESDYILEGFRDYLKSLDIRVNLDHRLSAQGLCFLPLRAPTSIIQEVAKFAFLRAAREAPRMRPVTRAVPSSPTFKYILPAEDAIDPTIRVVVLDGGMPKVPDLSRWSNRRKAKGVGAPVHDLVEHGLGVTSSLLFGPLEENGSLPRPYANVDHYRVVDEHSASDNKCEYFEVIRRIMTILENGRYDFGNLSIGPDLPIEDDTVHAWTSMLDQFLHRGEMLFFTAAGNYGERDHASGNARIQSPADCVNGVAIGSADSLGCGWKRSSHSSIGPGRSPGVVKPDALAFGGCAKTPFYVIGANGTAVGQLGTSFAAPFALRAAIGVRAYLGPVLSPLALNALIVHRCEPQGQPRSEVGWGKVPESVEDLITCEPGAAHIVYQGRIPAGAWMRAPIPMPDVALQGMVNIRATLCFATETDPQDPINYTRSGLEVRFRPHDSKKKEETQKQANTRTFMSAKRLYAGEMDLRADAHKWETTLHDRINMRGSSLHNPTLDIHHNARKGGGLAFSSQSITYALIVSVQAKHHKDLYNQIVRRYRTVLEALRPVVEIPIRH